MEDLKVYFGDNVIGKKLDNGNIVILEYIVTNKTEANGASTFSGTAVGGVSNITIESVAVTSGGAEPETIQSIKYYVIHLITLHKKSSNDSRL